MGTGFLVMVRGIPLMRQQSKQMCSFLGNKPFLSSPSRLRNLYARASLPPPDVSRLAETARISLTEKEIEEFSPKIQQVIGWFGQLQAVDLESVEPALRADAEEDNLRQDAPEAFENREALIAAVPSYEDPYIKVPKVLNKE